MVKVLYNQQRKIVIYIMVPTKKPLRYRNKFGTGRVFIFKN